MDVRQRAVEGICNLAFGVTFTVVCAPLGLAAISGSVIAGAIGATVLIDSVSSLLKRHGLENKREMKRLRENTIAEISKEEGNATHEAQKAIHAADKVIVDQLHNLQLDLEQTVNIMFEPSGFSDVATEIVFGSLRDKTNIFHAETSPVDHALAEKYVKTLLKAAFSSLTHDRVFFDRIHPTVAFETMRVLGKQSQSLDEIASSVGEIHTHTSQIKQGLDDVKRDITQVLERTHGDYVSELQQKLQKLETEKQQIEERKDKEVKQTSVIAKSIEELAQKIEFALKNPAKFSVFCSWLNDATKLEHLRTELTLQAKNWSKFVWFSDTPKPKPVLDVYVELDAYVSPRRLHMDAIEAKNTKPLQEVFSSRNRNMVLLGGPGAGKTTSMKKLCQDLVERNPERQASKTPLLFRLRDLRAGDVSDTIIEQLVLRELGVFVQYAGSGNEALNRDYIFRKLYKFVGAFISPIVILDGFDECETPDLKRAVLTSFRSVCTEGSDETGPFHILTCRTGEFNYSIDNTEVFELVPLKKKQIREFSNNWLDEQTAASFLEQLERSPFYDTAIKPLNIAHLCAIYARLGFIPEQPKSVYFKIVHLLASEWDQQRSVKRISQYSAFDDDRKIDFLSHLGWLLTTEHHKTVFDTSVLKRCYQSLADKFELPRNECDQVVLELEAHTGLLFQSGLDQYEFAHKSLQEYLTANHLVKLPRIPDDRAVILQIASELAIAVSISSSPADYLSELVFGTLVSMKTGPVFVGEFISRLIQERPTFGSSDNVEVAILSLLSEAMLNFDRELSEQYNMDSLVEMFITLLADRQPRKIHEYYEVAGTGAGNYVTLTRRIARPLGHVFPPQLHIASNVFKKLGLKNFNRFDL